jgi:hypothetical protein
MYFEPKHSDMDVVISGGYRIASYNHVMPLNLNIFKIILSFASPLEHWSSSVSVPKMNQFQRLAHGIELSISACFQPPNQRLTSFFWPKTPKAWLLKDSPASKALCKGIHGWHMHVDLFLKENIYYLCFRQGAGQENNVSDGGRGSCVFSGDFIAEKRKKMS